MEATAGWTLTQRDQLGRIVYTTSYTGSDPPYPWGNNLTSSGASSSIYNGYSTLSKDQANRSRQTIVDAQGRLKTVTEDPGVDRLGYLTTYTYDALDNLKTVNQGGLTRAFSYSSLKRLTSAQNPESGTITYGYDSAGNLLNRTELRVSLAISGYDALNRPLSKNYTPNTTPAVSYGKQIEKQIETKNK